MKVQILVNADKYDLATVAGEQAATDKTDHEHKVSIQALAFFILQRNKEAEESMSANLNKINNANASPLMRSELN
jgi:hypothetical protein